MKAYNYTFMCSHYNEDTKKTTVTISTKLGQFAGCSKCHPDEEHPSYIFGGRLAEGRALEKYLKAERRIAKFQLKTLQDLYNSITCMNDFSYDNTYTSKIRRAIYEKHSEINHINALITQLNTRIAKLVSEREILLNNNLFKKDMKS